MTHPYIPILDLSPEISLMREELDAAYHQVIEHGRFIMGPEVELFEKQVAEYIGVRHAIGVNSGTDALLIALRAAGIGAGDEVITTSFTFFATAESIVMAGATPVFVDVRPDDYNIDPTLIESAISDKTKAIIPVHLFGKPALMKEIMTIAQKHNLHVIEDCAQSFGAFDPESNQLTGSIGHVGAFSFFPSKNLGGFGDGGMITTNDTEIAGMARKLRAHGSVKKYHNEVMGYNSRLDTLQAALLSVKLKYIDQFNQQRRDIAHEYINSLGDVSGLQIPTLPDEGHVYHQFSICFLNKNRDDAVKLLDNSGVGTMVYYPIPCHELPVFGNRYKNLTLPVTSRVSSQIASLPIGSFLSDSDQSRVISTLKKVLSS